MLKFVTRAPGDTVPGQGETSETPENEGDKRSAAKTEMTNETPKLRKC